MTSLEAHSCIHFLNQVIEDFQKGLLPWVEVSREDYSKLKEYIGSYNCPHVGSVLFSKQGNIGFSLIEESGKEVYYVNPDFVVYFLGKPKRKVWTF